jgi:hypothetical protein
MPIFHDFDDFGQDWRSDEDTPVPASMRTIRGPTAIMSVRVMVELSTIRI